MDIRKIVKSRKLRGALMYGFRFLPDAAYVSLFYYAVNGRFPDLKDPKGYTEKLQWIKLHDRHYEYSKLADKLLVKQHVDDVLGPGYTFPLLGTWKKFEDIDFNQLPNEFVLKCNHDSGSVRLIHDKNTLTQQELETLCAFYNKRVKQNFYYAGREDCYHDIEPFIMAEKMMHSAVDDEGGIKDYKFLCFNGEPKVMFTVSGRQTEKHEDYFDMDYNWLPVRNGWTESSVCPPKPACFEEMKTMAAKLSQGIRQCRMDLYEIDGKPYFGEYTFYNGGGFEMFTPQEWELKFGSWIDLSGITPPGYSLLAFVVFDDGIAVGASQKVRCAA